LSIQNSEATAFTAMRILADLYDKRQQATSVVLPIIAWRVRADMNENLGCTLKATAGNGC